MSKVVVVLLVVGGPVATRAAIFVVVVVVVVVAGVGRAWTRQAPWYVPCGEAMCVVCHKFPACVHASLNVFSPKTAIYIDYILVPQKGTKIVLVPKPKATRLIIKYRSTSAHAIHSSALQSSLYIRLTTKLQYIYTFLQMI